MHPGIARAAQAGGPSGKSLNWSRPEPVLKGASIILLSPFGSS
jgi:hypothetical protein